jgi:adenylate cyclase
MEDAEVARLAEWLIEGGLTGTPETALLSGFCRQARQAGLPLGRVLILVDTLHPIHEGRAYRWGADRPEEAVIVDYGSTKEGEAAERWRRSPLYQLVVSGEALIRKRLDLPEPPDSSSLDELRADGMVDYLALIHRFAADGVIGEMDCVYSVWATDAAEGFSERQVAGSRSSRPRWRASPRRWSRPISAATPAGACSAAASCAASPRRSAR